MNYNLIILKELDFFLVLNQFKCEYLMFQSVQFQLADIYLGYLSYDTFYKRLNAAFVILNKSRKQGFIPLNSSLIDVYKGSNKFMLTQIVKEPTVSKICTLTSHINLQTFSLKLQLWHKQIHSPSFFSCSNVKSLYICIIKLISPVNLGIEFDESILYVNYLDLLGQMAIIYAKFNQLYTKTLNIGNTPQFLLRNKNFLLNITTHFPINLISNFFVSSYERAQWLKNFLIMEFFPVSQTILTIRFYRIPYKSVQLYYFDLLLYELLQPIVYTLYGIYIHITKTEALISIDVNSGLHFRFNRTVLQTNLIATKCILRQIKLRNLAGVIVIDFIDMTSQHDQLIFLSLFKHFLTLERMHINIIQLSDIGLLELTRKRQSQSLYDKFCPTSTFSHSVLYNEILNLNKKVVKTNLLLTYTLFSNFNLIYN